MENLELEVYPSKILRNKSEEINEITTDIKIFIDDLIKAMYEWDGIGLAAPQVGKNIKIFVMDHTAGEEETLRVIINPRILKVSEETDVREEGCLSLPGIFAPVTRPIEIEFEAVDLQGNKYKETLKGFEARVFQHEYDHLEGILFIDRLNTLDKLRIKPKLKKLEKMYKR